MMFKLFLLLPIILGPKCLVYSNDDNETSVITVDTQSTPVTSVLNEAPPASVADQTGQQPSDGAGETPENQSEQPPNPVDTKGLKLFTKDDNGVTMELDKKFYDVKPLNVNNNIIVFKLKDNAKCMVIKHDDNVIWTRDSSETPMLSGVKLYPKQVSFHTKPNIVFVVFEYEYLGYMFLGKEWKHLLKKENKKPEERRPSLPPKEPEQQQPVEEKQEADHSEVDKVEESTPEQDDGSKTTTDTDTVDQDSSKPSESEDSGMVASSSGTEDQNANEESEEANEADQASGESEEGTAPDASDPDDGTTKAGEDGTGQQAEGSATDPNEEQEGEDQEAEESTKTGTDGDQGTEADGSTGPNEEEEDENEEAEESEESTKTGTDGDQDPSGGSVEADGTKTSGETSEGADGGSTFATTPEASSPPAEGAQESGKEGEKEEDGSGKGTPAGEPASTDAGQVASPKEAVILDIKNSKKSTPQFDYKKEGKVVTFTAKDGFGFSCVKIKKGSCCSKKDVEIWDAANQSEYATKVVLDGKGKKGKTVTIHLPGGKTKVFKKDGKNKPWNEVSQAK